MEAVFTARAAAPVLAFKEIKLVIINSLAREVSNSSNQVFRAIQSS